MAALALVGLVGLIVDERTIGGQPIWLKPLKFGVSFTLYALTLAWLLAHLRRGARGARWAAWIIAVMSVLEVGLITFQAARGRASHFNELTPLDAAIFRSMGMVIAVLWLATVVVAVLLWRQGMPDRAGTWSVRLGMVLLLVGMAQGFFMIAPTEEQLAIDETPIVGAHAVGVPDGGPGLPLTGWSTTGGDLRIGHFVGIHALQAMLLVWMFLSWRVTDPQRRVRLVFVSGFAYLGLLVLVTWQALRGQPLIHPDALTWTAFGALVVATVLGAAFSWRRRATPAE